MTRLQNYMNEEIEVNDLISILKKDCKKFIKFVGLYNPPALVYRSIKGSNDDYTTRTPRTNRKPTDTPLYVQEIMDVLFYERFGWKPRSGGVFTATGGFEGYGVPHVFFPIGDFKFVWSPEVRDLFIDLSRLHLLRHVKGKMSPEFYEETKKTLKPLIDSFYQNEKYNLAFNEEREIVWKCKKYHLVNIHYFDFHKETLMKELFNR